MNETYNGLSIKGLIYSRLEPLVAERYHSRAEKWFLLGQIEALLGIAGKTPFGQKFDYKMRPATTGKFLWFTYNVAARQETYEEMIMRCADELLWGK